MWQILQYSPQIVSVSLSLRMKFVVNLFLLLFEVGSLSRSRKQLRSSVSQRVRRCSTGFFPNFFFFLFVYCILGRRGRCVFVRKISDVTKIDTTRADLSDVFSLLPPGFHFHVTFTSLTRRYREFPSRGLPWITREVKKRQSVTISADR